MKTAVLNVVALNDALIARAPRIRAFVESGRRRHLEPDVPAVTCTAQASMLTGTTPDQHGIVANGWYNREAAEVQFWKQSNHLVQGEKVWETARRHAPSITCATLFWWYNMYSSADWSVTPRPIYKADGRKIPDCYSHPAELRDRLQAELGTFPLFRFWGPATSIASTRWIADSTRLVCTRHDPTLTLVYLPHLDYNLQKLGPDHADISRDIAEIDTVVGDLIDFFHARATRVVLLSEYGIEPVTDAVHINRALREAGLLAVRVEQGLELLDAGASGAFAVVDHQVAHIYVRDRDRIEAVGEYLAALPGIAHVWDRADQSRRHLDHPRAGELIAVADAGRWFAYDYWLDDRCAPDFARTVDIHRKPGYDP
ncbi:MAG: alkaline phosphatase family protein, partial [Phycisphaerales bacterium]|nr:alkaline phosphatase family protein [Phycisphaerales bacterium]